MGEKAMTAYTVSSGVISSGMTLISGDEMTVLSGGVSLDTSVLNGGREIVHSGGFAIQAVISGGLERVFGALANGVVRDGGRNIVEAGGSASFTVISSGGIECVSGKTERTAVVSRGQEIVYSGGVASATPIKSGGLVRINSGGVAAGVTVSSGGTEIVSSGGSTKGTTISGGLLEVDSGAVATAIAFSGGGTLQLDDSVHFGGTIGGFGVSERLDLRDIGFTSGVTTASWLQSGTLIVTSGAKAAHLKLLGTHATSNLRLATDGHGGTLITDPPAFITSAGGMTVADLDLARPFSAAAQPSAGMAGSEGASATSLLLPLDGGSMAPNAAAHAHDSIPLVPPR
jgi:autotransporter passenger strand-loop-strand repeat protein